MAQQLQMTQGELNMSRDSSNRYGASGEKR